MKYAFDNLKELAIKFRELAEKYRLEVQFQKDLKRQRYAHGRHNPSNPESNRCEPRFCKGCGKELNKAEHGNRKYHKECWQPRKPLRVTSRLDKETYEKLREFIPEGKTVSEELEAMVFRYIKTREDLKARGLL